MIAPVTCEFVRAAIACGYAGIFFATPQAFDEATYRRYAEAHDHRVLHAVRYAGAWFNVRHMHGDDVLYDVLKSHPVDALNWHIGETPPAMSNYRASGGLQRARITNANLDAIFHDVDHTFAQTQKRGIIIAPACVIRYVVDERALLKIINKIKCL